MFSYTVVQGDRRGKSGGSKKQKRASLKREMTFSEQKTLVRMIYFDRYENDVTALKMKVVDVKTSTRQ